MSTIQKQRYFNELAPRWDDLPSPADADARVSEFVRRAALPGAKRILDVGCGTGILLPHLLRACPAAACVVELDLAEEMLEQNARKGAHPGVYRVCADLQSLPFTPESFDLVLCFSVLPHVGDLRSAVRELLRVLRPGGIFSVGHLMGSRELNAFHSGLGGPAAGDRLLPSQELAGLLEGLGAPVVVAEEKPDWYFVRARRTAS